MKEKMIISKWWGTLAAALVLITAAGCASIQEGNQTMDKSQTTMAEGLPPEEEPFRITHGPYLQNMSAHEVTVVWTTNKDAISWVELTPGNSGEAQPERVFAVKNGLKYAGRLHTVQLSGLSSGASYRYRVCSQEVSLQEGYSVVYGKEAAAPESQASFVTLNPAKPTVTFTVVNDIHEQNDVLERMLTLADPSTNDMLFFNGDMVGVVLSEDFLFDSFMDLSVKMFASEIPMYYARGNHEARGNEFVYRFQDYFSPSSPALYYLVRQGPVCFVVLDSGEDKVDSHAEYSGMAGYDNYRSVQAEWLRTALKSEAFTGAAFKVAICHIPPSDDEHGGSEVLNKFVPLLNEAGLDVMLSGHLHRLARREANGQVKFPVLVSSTSTFVKATAAGKTLTLDMIDTNGRVMHTLVINK